MKDIKTSAAALFDGGWRAEDIEELKAEYMLTDEEAQELAGALRELAEDEG